MYLGARIFTNMSVQLTPAMITRLVHISLTFQEAGDVYALN